MIKFKVTGITTNPEQFRIEFDNIFGSSKLTMNKRTKHEDTTMIHLEYTSELYSNKDELMSLVPAYLLRTFNFDIKIVTEDKVSTPVNSNPFYYDAANRTLLIADKTTIRITMNPGDVVEFMSGISSIKGVFYKPDYQDIANNREALVERLLRENYRKLNGPIDCDVYGCFNNDFPNLLMLEVVYPYTGSRHVNVTIDLDKF